MSFDKKNTYEDLKRENEKLKQKLDALIVKHQGKAYTAEGAQWDDTDSDEDVEYGNLALMEDLVEATPRHLRYLLFSQLLTCLYLNISKLLKSLV